jgi:[ribosomal protein S5]-alanine N-acetyltransferase
MRVLETHRLLLRDFVPFDWDAINMVLSDAEVTRYMHFAYWNEEKRRAWFEECIANSQQPDPDVYNWAISLKDTGKVIGWLGIGSASHPTMERERDFGYVLNRHFWRRGIMTEAVRAVLAYEFEVLGTLRVFATCETGNIGSARVMEKAGMHYEGTVQGMDFEGNWANRHRYALHAHEYRSRDYGS